MNRLEARGGKSAPDRREVFGLAGALALAGPASAAASPRSPNSEARTAIEGVSTETPIVATAHGRLKGYRRRGVNIFKGVPYAGAPTGEARFRRAPPCPNWAGVRNALNFGPICPHQVYSADQAMSEWVFLLPQGQPSAQSEDCLRLNIWTPAPDSAQRPVMVWLHAQGFGAGSSQEFLATDGEALSRSEDVVVVSLNHRIGALGFLDLAVLGGAPYAVSGNVGMLDIVDALTWVRRNIAAFGGDPDNVTLFGQSGGGFKISVLLGMPAAAGLFHRAIIQSGSRLRVNTGPDALKLTNALLGVLGLSTASSSLQALATTPVDTLVKAANEAARQLAATAAPPPELSPPSWYWQPVVDGESLPEHPFDPAAPAVSSAVPLLVTTVLNEVSPSVDAPVLETIDWVGVEARLKPELGAKTLGALEILKTDRRGLQPIDALSILQSRHFRLAADALIRRRTQSGGAPVFNGLFCWKTDVFERRPRAFHTSDVPFVFNNTDLVDQYTGGTERARSLGLKVSAAWAAFARHGVPGAPGLPTWPPCTRQDQPTMVLDDICTVVSRPDGRLLDFLSR